jgi:hypothetical protein
MKKTTTLISIISLSSLFALTSLNVFAENNNNESNRGTSTQNLGATSPRPEQGDKQERDGRDNEMRGGHDKQDSEMDNEGEDDATEVSLHGDLSKLPDINIKSMVTPLDLSSTTITTYADVVSILNQYQNAIKTITTSGTLGTTTTSTLSVQEQTVLGKLVHKHIDDFNRLNARAGELSSQIQDLIDALTPLGSTTITSSFNLKNLLISQIKDFTGAINDLKDLNHTQLDILDQETN